MVTYRSRRAYLGTLSAGGAVLLAGCTGGSGADGPSDSAALPDDPTAVPELTPPSEHVGSEAYLERLGQQIAAAAFPVPNPVAAPALTTARYVREAATAAGDDEFAEAVRERREPVFEPLLSFDETMTEIQQSEATPEEQQEQLEQQLDRRTGTFLDYPGPPHHFVESAEQQGQALLDGREQPGDVPAEYADERRTVQAVAAGASAATDEWLDDVGFEDGTPGDGESERQYWLEYGSREQYVAVVSFNIALAAESWLADDGEIPYPP